MDTRESTDDVLHIMLQALSLCCNSNWSAPKTVGGCTLETASVEGWSKKAIRVTRNMASDCDSFETFMMNPKNKALYESTLNTHEMVQADRTTRIFHTTYKASGLVNARDFCTLNAGGELPEAQVEQLMDALRSTPVPDGGAGYFFTSVDSKHVPPSTNIIRGIVHAFGYFAVPMSEASAKPKAQMIKVVHVSCVDPKGSIPGFAWESTHKETCKSMDKIAELVQMHHSMKGVNLRASLTSASPGSNRSSLTAAASASPAASPAREEESSVAATASAEPEQASPAPKAELRASSTSSAGERHVDPVAKELNVTSTEILKEEEKAPAVEAQAEEPEKAPEAPQQEVPKETTVEATPQQDEVPAAPEPEAEEQVEEQEEVRCITAPQRPLMNTLLALHSNRGWAVSKTLEDCVMEVLAIPGTKDAKAYKVTTEFNCSLETLENFLADEAQLRKYDPTLDVFEILSQDGHTTVVYTNQKQQTRLIKPRDFCTRTATVLLCGAEAEKENFEGQVFLQSSVNEDAKPVQKNYVRGTIHVYGYVAVPKPHGEGIVVHNIMRVDPGGSIPKWVQEAAQAENCKKLATIRRMCEEFHKSIAHLPTVKRCASTSTKASSQSKERESVPRVEPTATPTKQRTTLQEATPSPRTSMADYVSVVSEVTAAESVASADFQSCVDEDEFEEQLQDIKQFYEPEAKAVCDNLVNLHARRGWEEHNFIGACRVETMLTDICDKKAYRISTDFRCTLEAFRSTLSKIELVRKYDPGLDRFEILDSPSYGTITYTSYKSGGRFVSSRDFCTLTCERLLTDDEGSSAGLYTEGIRSSAFVQSAIDSKDSMPEQKGLVRGIIHAYGFIAIATPPDSDRIRVFNLGLIDPCGNIPAKLVDAAVSDTCGKLETIRRLAETGAWKAATSAAVTPTTSSPSRTIPAEPSKYPEIDTAPFFNRLFRMHTERGWSDKKQVGKSCLVDTLSVDYANVKAQRFSTEFMCSLATFEAFVSSKEDIRKYTNHLETIEFLESPPNATVTYTSYRSTSRLLTSRDFCTMTAQKRLTDEESNDIGLYTKGIKSEVFVQSAINCKDVPDKKGFVRGTVHAYGFIAIATPPGANRIRVFHYACLDPNGKIPSKVVDWGVTDTANKLSKMAALCHQRELEREALNRQMANDEEILQQQREAEREAELVRSSIKTGSSDDRKSLRVSFNAMDEQLQEDIKAHEATTTEEAAPVACNDEEEASVPTSEAVAPEEPKVVAEEETKEGETATAVKEEVPQQEKEDDVVSTTASRSSMSSTTGLSSAQKIIFERLLQQHKRHDWKKVSVTEGCLMEEVAVPFSDKNALRISCEFNCSLETFAAFLADPDQIRKYDENLNEFEVLSEADDLVTIYTNYKQVSRFVTPRDFVTITSKAMLPGFIAEQEAGIGGFSAVYLQNSGSTLKAKGPVNNYVRGQIHMFGYIATVKEGETKITVHNILCADPGGRIPKWILDAAKAENCKKLTTIRKLCETYIPPSQ